MADQPFSEDAWDEETPPSKSALKRQMTALQDMGERLVELSDAQLKKVPIDDPRLSEAIAEARRIKARGGLRRQLQYIGKLMRQINPDGIQQALDELDGQHQEVNARFHQLEKLREKLINEGDRALEEIVAVFPDADRQHLRQLLRQHEQETKQGKANTAFKKLFRYFKELDGS
jgi:ribosome-associated protein